MVEIIKKTFTKTPVSVQIIDEKQAKKSATLLLNLAVATMTAPEARASAKNEIKEFCGQKAC